jgi:hypothetical protein
MIQVIQIARLILFTCLVFGFSACPNNKPSDPFVEETIKLHAIPNDAEIIFHENNFIYAMNQDGRNITRITFDNRRTLEHVGVSYDPTKIAANYFSDRSIGGQSSKLLLYDFSTQTLVHLAPAFQMAGNGGVAWDKNEYVYVAGVAELPYPEISPDGESMVFSRGNSNVAPVFPDNPLANTAHDILGSNIDAPKDFFVIPRQESQ